jgi:hypothetical protein
MSKWGLSVGKIPWRQEKHESFSKIQTIYVNETLDVKGG